MDLGVVGSSPITHPIYRNGESARVGRSCLTGPSPSGKATDFDSVIALVRIQLAQPWRIQENDGVPLFSWFFLFVLLPYCLHTYLFSAAHGLQDGKIAPGYGTKMPIEGQ